MNSFGNAMFLRNVYYEDNDGLFSFGLPPNDKQDPNYAGFVAAVDTRKVMLDVRDESLERISAGKLAVLPIPHPDAWLVGFIDRVVCKPQYVSSRLDADDALSDSTPQEQLVPMLTQGNAVTITLAGIIQRETDSAGEIGHGFTRSIISVPDVHAPCFVLRREGLETFMGLLMKAGDTEHALAVGHYALDPTAIAYLDGDRFFQRHAVLLPSRIRMNPPTEKPISATTLLNEVLRSLPGTLPIRRLSSLSDPEGVQRLQTVLTFLRERGTSA